MGFSYRHSVLETADDLVIAAEFTLTPAEPEAIKARMKELIGKRSASQPLNLPSAGSAFKRPKGGYAAALIDQAGLKGFRVGNAGISDKHAGFAVNLGGPAQKRTLACKGGRQPVVTREFAPCPRAVGVLDRRDARRARRAAVATRCVRTESKSCRLHGFPRIQHPRHTSASCSCQTL